MATVNWSTRETTDPVQLGLVTSPYANDRRTIPGVTVRAERAPNGDIVSATVTNECPGCGCNHTKKIPVK